MTAGARRRFRPFGRADGVGFGSGAPGGGMMHGAGGSIGRETAAVDFATTPGGSREDTVARNLGLWGITNMAVTLRSVALGAALLWLLAATTGPTCAQQVRDREVSPAFDFNRIQMPVEFVSVKLNGVEVRPGEKVQGDDDWLRGLSFTLKNVSDKPLAYVAVALQFPRPQGYVAYLLSYGVDLSRGESRRESSPPAIPAGGTVNLVLTKEKYPGFLRLLERGEAPRSFDAAPYYVERVCFEGEPDVIWAGGMLKRRDPSRPTEFQVIERYTLPARQE